MKNVKKANVIKNFSPYIILVIIIGVMFYVVNMQGTSVHEISTGKLMDYLKENKVTEITITPKSSESIYYVEGKLEKYKKDESFKTKIVEEEVGVVTNYIKENNISKYNTNKDPGTSTIMYIIVNVVPFAIMIILAYLLFSRLASSNKNSMDFGRSKAKLSDDNNKKTFKDVAGLKEEK